MSSLATVQAVTYGGIGGVGVLGGGLTVAVVWAGTMPIHAPIRTAGIRVSMALRWALRMAFRVFALVIVGLAKVAWRMVRPLAVTYLHLGRVEGKGHHYPGRARRHGAGRHRAFA